MFKGENGKVTLFIINHLKEYAVIDKFDVQLKNGIPYLTFIERFHDKEHFHLLNNIKAISEFSFYATDHMYYRPDTLMGTVEIYSVMKYGMLLYYNGKKTLVVDSGLVLPNGVNMSPDGKYLYMVNRVKELRVYEIQQDHTVKLVQEVNLETGLDNINIDHKTGDLWIGCHPIGHKIMAYLKNHDHSISPSQVIRIRTNKGLLTDYVEEMFVDDGHMISASASAICHMDGLLIGSVCHSAVYCQVKHLEK
jgi:hypothetical protein